MLTINIYVNLFCDSNPPTNFAKLFNHDHHYYHQAKIMQCQQTTLDLGAKLAGEKRDRDQDFDQVSLYHTSASPPKLKR